MDNNKLERVRYFKGQLLTARDFEDEQTYHRKKLLYLLRRFPPGIVGGLDVECDVDEKNDPFIIITEGVAVDKVGNILFVPENGIKIPLDDIPAVSNKTPYLSIYYKDEPSCSNSTPCVDVNKANRTIEEVKYSWDSSANLYDSANDNYHITLAHVTKSNSTCNDVTITTNSEPGEPPIRINATTIDEENVRFRDSEGHDHSGVGGKGTPIPEKEGVVFTDQDGHDHTGDSKGTLVPEAGLVEDVRNKLVKKGNNHTHNTDDPEDGGGKIAHSSLELGSDTNPHGTTAADIDEPDENTTHQIVEQINRGEAKINSENIDDHIIDRLVEKGNAHNHSGVVNDENFGLKINHSDLNFNPGENVHAVTAELIDTQGGTDQIVSQINAGTGVINRERIAACVISREFHGTIQGNGIDTIMPLFSGEALGKPRIVQVLPVTVGGELSCSSRISREAGDSIRFLLEIRNHSDIIVEYIVKILEIC